MSTGTHKEWKMYFDMSEADMKKCPTNYNYQMVYFRHGKHDHDKDVMYFPVEISSGRVSFGKVQFLITPSGVVKGILGKRWVNRNALVMQHDRLFDHLNRSVPTRECPDDAE